MPHNRFDNRRSGVRASPLSDTSQDGTVARGVSVEETFQPDVDELPRPAGFGTEASTSAQSFSVVDEYSVPPKTLAYVREVSASVESNGEVILGVPGTNFGPFTGQTDVAVPLDPGVLTEGDTIRVLHQSTDGTTTTTQAQVVVLEV